VATIQSSAIEVPFALRHSRVDSRQIGSGLAIVENEGAAMRESWFIDVEFAAIIKVGLPHLRRLRPGLKHREVSQRTRNGKRRFEYSSLNLSAEEQLSLAPHVLAAPTKENLTLTANAQRELARPCGFTPKQESEFAEVRELIRPMLERKDGDPRTLDELAAEIGLKNVGWLNKTGEPAPLGKSTVWRYYSNFRKGNLFSLVRAVRKDRGRSQFFASHLAASAFVQQKYLNEGLSFQMCWEALRRDWKKVDGAGDPPSYGATRKFLRTIQNLPAFWRTKANMHTRASVRSHYAARR